LESIVTEIQSQIVVVARSFCLTFFYRDDGRIALPLPAKVDEVATKANPAKAGDAKPRG